MQTAQLLSMDLGIPPQNILIDDRIREQYYGSYEGRPWDDYEAYFPSPDDVYTGAVPGGESGCEVLARALDFLRSIACKYHDKTLLIVTHSFVYGQINFALEGVHDDIPQAGYKIYPRAKGQ
jgi:broad specificity phosphatase PhoE